jgi:hypothetical protein
MEVRAMALAEESQNNGANEAWASGNNLWLIDAVVPFGGREEVLATLRREVFGGCTAKKPPTRAGRWTGCGGVVSLFVAEFRSIVSRLMALCGVLMLLSIGGTIGNADAKDVGDDFLSFLTDLSKEKPFIDPIIHEDDDKILLHFCGMNAGIATKIAEYFQQLNNGLVKIGRYKLKSGNFSADFCKIYEMGLIFPGRRVIFSEIGWAENLVELNNGKIQSSVIRYADCKITRLANTIFVSMGASRIPVDVQECVAHALFTRYKLNIFSDLMKSRLRFSGECENYSLIFATSVGQFIVRSEIINGRHAVDWKLFAPYLATIVDESCE